jgi:STE24 endopeptidase
MSLKSDAKKYERIKLSLSISETVISIVLILIIIFAGYAIELRNWAQTLVQNPYAQLLIFAAILGLIFSVISIPLSFISGFWLEHYYGLSNQSFFAWVWEKLKGLFVGLILIIPILLIFYYFLRNYPDSWWFWTATVMFLFSVVIGRIAPVLIFPLFYKFEKLDDPGLIQRMEKLAKEGKFKLEGVYRFNMSKTTKKANAAFTGLGKSKRIILGDTLIDKFTHDEIEAVFAHEVGHYVHKHMLVGIITGTIASYLSLFIAHQIYNGLLTPLGYNAQADLAALPLLSLILTIISLVSSPIMNINSRRHERQADRYALKHSSVPIAFLTALKKLGETNLADESPHPAVEFLFHSHPSIKKRLEFAQNMGVAFPLEA